MATKRVDLLLLIFSAVLTAAAVLGLVRWFAPGLLGVPSDLQLVGLDRKVPPFFENIFRREDLKSSEFILKDPLTRVRAKPFYPDTMSMGPNDLLGFRNREIPNVVDVVVIGDSQTYGNNASIDDNWPGHMKSALSNKNASVYNMSVGGWGAVQYLDMFTNATAFEPRVVVIAFYSGNDSLESFQMAYGVPAWSALRPNTDLTKSSAPKVQFPPPPEEWWRVQFRDGVETTFTPALRLSSNTNHAAVEAGYEIMADVVRRIAEMSSSRNTRILFTIVPTKELVYARKVSREDLSPPASYQSLVERESEHIAELVAAVASKVNVEYVDVVKPLQEAAMDSQTLYPSSTNGHPISAGYKVIGDTIAKHVFVHLPDKLEGLYAQNLGEDKYSLLLVNEEGVWRFTSAELIEANGWPPGDVPLIESRDLVGLPRMGIVEEIDRARFGPGGV